MKPMITKLTRVVKRLLPICHINTSLVLLVYSLVFFLPCIGSAQRILIDGKEQNRDLTWDDFKGKANKEVHYHAMTYTTWNYDYKNVTFRNDTAKFDFNVSLSFDHERSWVRKGKENPELLVHEQMHFEIAKLSVLELQQRVASEWFTRANLRSKLLLLKTEVMNKYSKMQVQYDTETNHSANTTEQQRWNELITAEVARLTKEMSKAATD